MGAAPSVANVPLPPILLREHAERLLLLSDNVPKRITEDLARELCGKSFDVDIFKELKQYNEVDIPREAFLTALLNNRDKIKRHRKQTEENIATILSSPSARAVVDLIKSFESEKQQHEQQQTLQPGNVVKVARKYEPPIMVMVGAGISVSAGIPDFRTPGTGLYDNLQAYNLPSAESIFDIQYFKKNPGPFCMLAREMWPGNFSPTPTHGFLVLLERKGLLLRCYSQNIDTLEREAGLSAERIVEAHGSFAASHCTLCGQYYSQEWMKQKLNANNGVEGRSNVPRCESCYAGIVKPDITFFGEHLPERFRDLKRVDCPKARLLMVMGTSLAVSPFNELINSVPLECPRLLINKELVAMHQDSIPETIGGEECFRQGIAGGFKFGRADNCRDAALIGNCDDKIWQICIELGWKEELEGIMASLTPAKEMSTHMEEGANRLPPIVPLLSKFEADNGSTTSREAQKDNSVLDADWSNSLVTKDEQKSIGPIRKEGILVALDSDESSRDEGGYAGIDSSEAKTKGAAEPNSTVSDECVGEENVLKMIKMQQQKLQKQQQEIQMQLEGFKLAQAKRDGAIMLCRAAAFTKAR